VNDVERHEREIEELRSKAEGVPERLDAIEKQVSLLSESINAFISELRHGYVTNEICQLCRDKQRGQIERNTERIASIQRVCYAMVAFVASGLLALIMKSIKA